MYDFAVMSEWLSFGMRWLHVITAITWIGASFYFIALDLGLRPAADLPKGARGEEWQVHGGGFYHIRKYMVAPATLPEHLTWFKWESYATWMSGFALLVLVYYGGAELYLIDANVLAMPVWGAVAISVGSIVLGWYAYDAICKSWVGRNDTRLMLVLYLILVALSYAFTQVFTARAAFLHPGIITATIMSANVFLVIIPNQRIVVEDLKAGRVPEARYGQIAKQRSTHNNYLTLPVLFLMLASHNPLAFATPFNWVIASLVFLMGVTIRHYFNRLHAREHLPRWTWAVTILLFIAIAWLSSLSRPLSDPGEAMLTPGQQRFAEAGDFAAVSDIVRGRCSMCHASEPFYDNIRWAPKGVMLESETQIAAHAREIYLQSGISHAMPPGNVSLMEARERALIARWYQGATGG